MRWSRPPRSPPLDDLETPNSGIAGEHQVSVNIGEDSAMPTDEITTAFADVGQKQDGRATRLDHIVKGGHRLPHIPPGVLIRPTGSARQRINNDQADARHRQGQRSDRRQRVRTRR